MREIPEAMTEALSGSDTTATLTCRSTYAGEIVADHLEVSSWSLSWRLGDQQTVQGSGSFVVQDPEGELAPWGFDEPLAVGGSRIQATFDCAGETVPMGEWLVNSNAPNESWRLTRHGIKWVHGGATVPIEASDLTQLLEDANFMSPEAPQAGATVGAEIRRLCAGIVGVQINTDVSDMALPRNMVYESRINTVADLVHLIGEYRVNGDGLLEVFNPERPAAPLWQIHPGPGGALISVNRQQSRDGLYNAVVATGQTDDGRELRAYSTLETGPLRFDGPFGRKPMEKSSLGTTQSAVFKDAESTLRNQVANGTTTLIINCAPTPLYEIGDWGEVTQPLIDGTVHPLIGRCTEITLDGGTAGLSGMKVSLECATADVLAVARYVRAARG